MKQENFFDVSIKVIVRHLYYVKKEEEEAFKSGKEAKWNRYRGENDGILFCLGALGLSYEQTKELLKKIEEEE